MVRSVDGVEPPLLKSVKRRGTCTTVPVTVICRWLDRGRVSKFALTSSTLLYDINTIDEFTLIFYIFYRNFYVVNSNGYCFI